MSYNRDMISIKKTATFEKWIRSLPDKNAVARINIRIKRLHLGNPGDIKSVGGGIFELRIDYGPGYRIYIYKYKNTIIVLMNGGDKSTQSKDIEKAKILLKEIGDIDEQ